MSPIKYEENQTLRDESMEYLYKKEELRKFTITTTIAVLTLVNSGIWQDASILYLIPAVVIVLGLISTLGMERRIKEITTYRIVFLENGDNDVRWARAVTRYDMAYNMKKELAKMLGKFDYVVLFTLCLVIYISKFAEDVIVLIDGKLYFSPELLLCVVLMLLLMYTVYLSVLRCNLGSEKRFNEYIENWKIVKNNDLDF